MRRPCRAGRAVACALLLAGCVTTGPVVNIAPGQRPDVQTDEAGLWMTSDGVERALATSGRVVEDPALNAYVRAIACDLAPEHCADLRLYIVDAPYFNASMLPNGAMQIWTGLMLRARNEAQLAYVMGHEIGHYVRRHSVERWRDLRAVADLTAIFQLATSAAGLGYVGQLGTLAALGSLMAFSREQEREADDLGFDLMVRAGYDPGEAAKIWEAVIEEREAAEKDEAFFFFATHPRSKDRVTTLRDGARGLAAGERHEQRYRAAVAPFRAGWLRGEVRKRETRASAAMLGRLLRDDPAPGEIQFYLGEVYRLGGDEGDDEEALAAYREAHATLDAPPEAYRSEGLVHRRRGEKGAAREAFRTYLRLAPAADDRAMVQAYLAELEH
jgi:predicted Zn-dependent protease